MPYLTLTKNLKLQLSPGLVASYDIQPRNGVGLFWDKHTHIYILTHLPRTHMGHYISTNASSACAKKNNFQQPWDVTVAPKCSAVKCLLDHNFKKMIYLLSFVVPSQLGQLQITQKTHKMHKMLHVCIFC